MKIIYICLNGLYIPGWSYQENVLSKYHVQDGHDVTIITSKWICDHNSNFILYNGLSEEYDHGAKIIRLDIKGNKPFCTKLKRFEKLYETIEMECPECIFLHGPQLFDADTICRYMSKHKGVNLIVDNHSDFRNSAKNWISKNILHRLIWKHSVHLLNEYASIFYGVTPARVDFLTEMYGLDKERIKLLPFGADDELVEKNVNEGCRIVIRDKFGIMESDTLLLTGGKIDRNKPEILDLMDAIISLGKTNVKLMVFGSVIPELHERFEALISSQQIIYIGWQKSEDIYRYQEAADLMVFPGLHSVLWEQAVGSGKACLFRKIDGFTHIDIGGNCEFFEELTVEAIREKIEHLIAKKKIKSMTKIAQEKGKKVFSYRQISRDCIAK